MQISWKIVCLIYDYIYQKIKLIGFMPKNSKTYTNNIDKMQTRSMTKRVQFSVDIDFDGASKAWKANKVSKCNGTYGYKCERLTKKGEPCSQIACPFSDFCKKHSK
jgi:hypothetical protein